MAEYIERESLLEQMEGFCKANCGCKHSEDPLCESCGMNDAIIYVEDRVAADVVERDSVIDTAKSWLRVNGKCPTCKRCSDNRNDGTTMCPIEESYRLTLDGFCHLYEPKEE